MTKELLEEMQINEQEMDELVEKIISLGFTEEMLSQLYFVMSLIKIYVDRTGKKLFMENLKSENGILAFIRDIKPILPQLGGEITLSDFQIEGIVKELVLHMKTEH